MKVVIISVVILVVILIAFVFTKRKSGDGIHGQTIKSGKFANDSFKVRPLTSVKYERTVERLEHGQYLVNGILQCLTCHSPRNWDAPGAPPIAGKYGSGGTVLFEDSVTRIVAPNITPDEKTGAGTWTDDMFARAIREGVGHDGRALNWQMPHFIYRSVSDEDLASVIVYLRSLPSVYNVVLPGKMSAAERSGIEKALNPITEPVLPPDLSDNIKRGRYLVRIGECVGCHTSHSEYNPGINGGGNHIERFGRKDFSANITTDSSGIPYGPEGFMFVMRTGKGGSLSPIMPWVAFKNMNDEDLKAIYAYLATLPPSQHHVSNQPPFTHCAICGLEHGQGDKNKRSRPVGIKLDPKVYDLYAGTYLNEAYNSSYTISREGNGLVGRQWENGPKVELIPQSELHFLAPGWPVPVSFVKDETGRVVQLVEDSDYGMVFKKVK